jgi:DNA-directed RNA polymerase subunit M/transcription elongation factor TFIIS
MPVRNCLQCGGEFDPGNTRRLYDSKACKKQNERDKAKEDSATTKVIADKGSRDCTNCRSQTAGPRFAFWWDNYDRVERNMETSMLLCYPCFFRFNKVKAKQDARILEYEVAAEG